MPRRSTRRCRLLLRAETSCNLYWGEDWVPRAEADLEASRAALGADRDQVESDVETSAETASEPVVVPPSKTASAPIIVEPILPADLITQIAARLQPNPRAKLVILHRPHIRSSS